MDDFYVSFIGKTSKDPNDIWKSATKQKLLNIKVKTLLYQIWNEPTNTHSFTKLHVFMKVTAKCTPGTWILIRYYLVALPHPEWET